MDISESPALCLTSGTHSFHLLLSLLHYHVLIIHFHSYPPSILFIFNFTTSTLAFPFHNNFWTTSILPVVAFPTIDCQLLETPHFSHSPLLWVIYFLLFFLVPPLFLSIITSPSVSSSLHSFCTFHSIPLPPCSLFFVASLSSLLFLCFSIFFSLSSFYMSFSLSPTQLSSLSHPFPCYMLLESPWKQTSMVITAQAARPLSIRNLSADWNQH